MSDTLFESAYRFSQNLAHSACLASDITKVKDLSAAAVQTNSKGDVEASGYYSAAASLAMTLLERPQLFNSPITAVA